MQRAPVDGERILAEDYVALATSLQNESATEEAVNPPAKDNFVVTVFKYGCAGLRESTGPTGYGAVHYSHTG
jgi:hypothetical protein